jgi:Zn-dependent metalloprotease
MKMQVSGFGVFAIALSLLAVSGAQAIAPSPGDEVLIVRLPHFEGRNAQMQMILTSGSVWQDFMGQNGPYHAVWNEYTNRPHRAYGPPIAAFGDLLSQPERTARDFISSHPRLFGVPESDLMLVNTSAVRSSVYLTFQQTYLSYPVEETYVQVRLNRRGIWGFGSDAYSHIQLSTAPNLQPSAAQLQAREGIQTAPETVQAEAAQLVILPVVEGDQVRHTLAYRVELIREEPAGRWTAWVDASSGELLRRISHIRNLPVSGTVTINMLPQFYNDPWSTQNLTHGEVQIQTQGLTNTNLSGQYSIEVGGGSYSLHSELKGLWVNVNQQNGNDALHDATVVGGQTHNWLWSTANAGDDECNAYYHVNYGHDWVKTLDPAFVGLDYQMPCEVNDTSYPAPDNAYWDGTGVHFGAGGSLFRDLALFSDVVYHEYFHGVTDKIYTGVSDPPSDIHEGMSDYFAATVTNDSLIGNGGLFLSGQTYMRTCENTLQYPDDMTGEGHFDGQILAGAWWDFRQLEGAAVSETLAHFAKYGFPYSFPEYFWEGLYADDDDFNLYNGTPHSGSLFEAFDGHGIGPGPGVLFDHDPYWNTQVTDASYRIEVMAYSMAYPIVPDSTKLYYSTGGGYTALTLTPFGDGLHYYANIPAQANGTLVRYYLRAVDANGNASTLPERAPLKTYIYLVGPTQVVLGDDFEGTNNWVVNLAGDDNATAGIWERGDPVQLLSDNGTLVSPEDDHTFNPGIICWQTQISAPGAVAGDDDVDGGKTSLNSPVFSAAGLTNPIISFFLFFTNNAGNNPGQDPFAVDLSNDGGTNWVNADSINLSRSKFTLYQYAIGDFLSLTANMRARFVARDQSPGSLVEASFDDFTVRAVSATATPLSLTLTPIGAPIIIGPGGGAFQFTASLSNSGASAVTTDAWTWATMPSGILYGPILTVPDLTLAAGASLNPTPTQNVPGGAPAGSYTYYGFLGDYSGANIYDASSFPFTKSGVLGGSPGLGDWTVTGDFNETSAISAAELPLEYALNPVYPNPFNPQAAISYQLSAYSYVSLKVYDVAGRLAETLVNGYRDAGLHQVTWDAGDLASGIYLVKLEAAGYELVQKALLMK